LSSVAADLCMESGKDIVVPEPSYAIYGITDRAIVDTGDSLVAIKKLVFDEKKLTMDELLHALDSSFEGRRGEQIRQMCLAAPKFGNDIDEVDLMVRELGAYSAKVIQSSKHGKFRISREGLSWHFFAGLTVGALPNGRKSKEPLNDASMSPMRGMDKRGPTAVLRSVLKAGFNESCASALNQRFSASTMQSPESKGKLVMLTDTFMRQGGQHIQYNLVNSEELRDAKVHPEKYQDLVVRIGGFSAYFVQLSPEIQDDVINRTEQGF
jgi:pyruvate-formate lyase